MENEFGQEFNVTHSQFVEGMTETIKITMDTLEILKKAYIKTQNPFCKIEMENYAESLADLIKLLKTYMIRVENGIEVQPIIFFTDKKALFGFRGKKDLEFAEKWYEIITKVKNGKEMVI